MRGKKRNVLYMRPIDKRRFLVTFAYRDEHVEAAVQSNVPREVVAEIQKHTKYPEGRMARVDVTTAAEYNIAKTLLEVKQSI